MPHWIRRSAARCTANGLERPHSLGTGTEAFLTPALAHRVKRRVTNTNAAPNEADEPGTIQPVRSFSQWSGGPPMSTKRNGEHSTAVVLFGAAVVIAILGAAVTILSGPTQRRSATRPRPGRPALPSTASRWIAHQASEGQLSSSLISRAGRTFSRHGRVTWVADLANQPWYTESCFICS
jgi:hypothetical protein